MEANSFRLSLDMILDESKQYHSMITETYYINEESLIDKVTQFDCKKIFTFVLNKFLDIIKVVWDKFKVSYHEFMVKCELLKKYRRKLENINYDVEINEGFPQLINLNNSTTLMFKMSLNNEYSTMIQNLEKISECRNISDIHSVIFNIKNEMDSINNYLDQQRGISISSDASIPESEYTQEVFKHFYSEDNITNVISAEEINLMTKEYFEYKSLEKNIAKDEYTLRTAAEDMIGKINNISIEKYCPDQLNNEAAIAFLDIIRTSCEKIHGLCNIYIQLFSIKLDMIKIYKQQQTKMLCKVILKSIEEERM
jgi:hypothetical protein